MPDSRIIRELRAKNDGTLPTMSGDDRVIVYMDRDEETLCAECANKNDSEAFPLGDYGIVERGTLENCSECGEDFGHPDDLKTYAESLTTNANRIAEAEAVPSLLCSD